MDMRSMHQLNEMLCGELEKIARKGNLNAGDLDTAHKLTDTIKNVYKIKMLEEAEEYSGDGMSGRRGYSRDGGRSYGDDDEMMRYPGRRYSRDGGDSYGRTSYGYSRDDGSRHMIRQLEGMMDNAKTEKERETIQRCISQIERA